MEQWLSSSSSSFQFGQLTVSKQPWKLSSVFNFWNSVLAGSTWALAADVVTPNAVCLSVIGHDSKRAKLLNRSRCRLGRERVWPKKPCLGWRRFSRRIGALLEVI